MNKFVDRETTLYRTEGELHPYLFIYDLDGELQEICPLPEPEGESYDSAGYLEAVSYTHLDVYKRQVVYSTGGGTYARTLQGRGVGFGGAFPESGDTCVHSANEHISVDDLKLHAQICLEAMYRMMTEDSELA